MLVVPALFPVTFRACYLVAVLTAVSSGVVGYLDRTAIAQEAPARPHDIVLKYCGDCHAQGEMEGNLDFDALLKVADPAKERAKWLAVWKNLRSQLMPPADQPQLSEPEKQALFSWIEKEVFHLDRQHPDPGRVTIRRLNRYEYRNTIKDMLNVDFDTNDAFPADDTGYGFDTIGDVLSLSPLQVEKYLQAAREITAKAVPLDGPRPPTLSVYPDNFKEKTDEKRSARNIPLSTAANFIRQQNIDHPGPYRCTLTGQLTNVDMPTASAGEVVIKVGDKEVGRRELTWGSDRNLNWTFEVAFVKGKNVIHLEVVPKTPPRDGEKELGLQFKRLDLHGPTDGSHVVYPDGYKIIFNQGPPPTDAAARDAYRRQILARLTERAFRRPVDDGTIDRLTAFAKQFDTPDEANGFEKGISESLTAVLASPRFLFRAEIQPEPDNRGQIVPLDEFSLASRLSYFLWSSLPDQELYELARKGKLRAQLRPQVDRMLADAKSQRFVRSFIGQWLQSRDVETINVDSRRILKLSDLGEAFQIFNANLRRSMREETEQMFSYMVAENRSLLDLLTPNYAFLNESLAKWYGIEGVMGNEMRKVDLPTDSERGGLLSQASFLIVSSNPTRTSPVKRGQFVLDNLLGAPAPPPPANVPALEVAKGKKDEMSMRELMVLHRADPLCASCHARMDPLGLALEEFDALGRWRKEENGAPIETAGKLVTGETFANVKELSRVIATERRNDFYTCVTEKLLTYALGRGVEYYDAPTVEKIVKQLHQNEGHIRTLIYGVIESAPFQQRRGDGSDGI